MTRTHPSARSALVIALVMAMTSVALAGEPAPTADSEYTRGKAALKAGDPSGALSAFKAGLKLAGDDEAAWHLVLACALAYEKGGQLHHAIEYYQRFFEESEQHQDALSPKWKRRRTLVQRDMARLEKQIATSHGYVTVATEPSGVQVLVDGVRAGADGDATSPVGFYLPAGDHVLSVRLAGHQLAEQTIALAAGKIRPLRFVLEPEPIPPPPDDTRAEAVDDLDDTPETDAYLSTEETPGAGLGPWLVIGSGGAMAIAAITTAAMGAGARSDWDSYNKGLGDVAPQRRASYGETDDVWRDHEETVATYDMMTWIFAGTAALTLGGGLVWLLLDDGDQSEAPGLSLVPTPGGAFAQAGWEF
jgi:tetratricopeptide (TPR) repeat protein